jgi:hypothetical protein
VPLDGNGRDDVLLYNPVTGEWTLLVNAAGAVKSVSGTWLPRLTITTGDVNGDGRRDVVLYDAKSGASVIALSVAPGRFEYRSGDWTRGRPVVVRP